MKISGSKCQNDLATPFRGVVDNPLSEARLHGLNQGDTIIFHEDHILAVHNIHRQELVAEMDEADLEELTQWIGHMRRQRLVTVLFQYSRRKAIHLATINSFH